MDTKVSSSILRIVLAVPAAALLYLSYRAAVYLIKPYLSPLRKLKGPKSDSILFGNMIDLARGDAYVRLREWRAEYGNVFVLHALFGDWRCVIADNKGIAHLLANHMSYYKPEFARFQLSYLLGHGLVSAEGLEHRHQRRIMTPAFSASHLRNILPTFLDKSAALSEMLRKHLEKAPTTSPDAVPSLRVDMITYLSKATIDIISVAGFNYDFDTLHQKPGEPGTELAGALHRFLSPEKFPVFLFLKGFIPLFRLWEWDAQAREARKARVTIRRIGKGLIEDGLKRVNEEKASGGGTDLKHTVHDKDLLSLMIKSNMSTTVPPEQRLSIEQMMNQIPTFLIAGHETTANSTAWCLYALCNNPTIQTRLREELLQAFPVGDSTEVTADALNALPYLEAVVRETLRFHPPVELSARVAEGDDVIPLEKPFVDKYGKLRECIEVKKGDAFIIPIMLMNRAKDIWGEDADEYNPDRWLNELPGKTAGIPGVWANLLTFLGGQRSCIGFKFAILEMKALLLHLLRNFEFQLAVKPEDIAGMEMIVTRPVVKHEKNKGAQLPVVIRPIVHNL
ncbi:related to Cytochrome P450 [Serendipita indica DSM 11827]|uniref:Related to Cytochrome P450 n=1 Tax=Serendipita indica (strain DSM 11827) TaxID=1109443 RepID=G4TCN7_SERID|nr:related to Cytochrome P450 [Serendipita indica DSM 11827]